MKEFLEKNSHFKLTIARSDEFGGCFVVDIYNLTLDRYSPVFRHVYTDLECENVNVDFNTFIMTPIRAWKKEQDDKYKEDAELCIICDMAIEYLKIKEREIEK